MTISLMCKSEFHVFQKYANIVSSYMFHRTRFVMNAFFKSLWIWVFHTKGLLLAGVYVNEIYLQVIFSDNIYGVFQAGFAGMKARKEVKAMREAQRDQDEAEPEAAEKQPAEEANKEEIDISKIFLKYFWWTRVHFWGHWYPCFGLLVMSALGIKARVGSLIRTWQRCI